jgi:hypothetical protein
MSQVDRIPPEVYEIIKAEKLVPEGATYKIRHHYDYDGVPCSVNKSRALSVTRKDGGWVWNCFRCGARGALKEMALSADEIRERLKQQPQKTPLDGSICLPDDTTRIGGKELRYNSRRIPWDAVTWLLKADIREHLLLQYFFGWSPSLHRVIMPIQSSEWTVENFEKSELLGWVGRDPVPRTKEERSKEHIPKYLTRRGNHGQRLLFTGFTEVTDETAPVIIVEDILSAIRVSDATNLRTIALLNTDIPRFLMDKITNKRRVILWLDNDMISKMIQYTSQFRQLGFDVRYVSTNKDPKCYNNVGIRQVVHTLTK